MTREDQLAELADQFMSNGLAPVHLPADVELFATAARSSTYLLVAVFADGSYLTTTRPRSAMMGEPHRPHRCLTCGCWITPSEPEHVVRRRFGGNVEGPWAGNRYCHIDGSWCQRALRWEARWRRDTWPRSLSRQKAGAQQRRRLESREPT